MDNFEEDFSLGSFIKNNFIQIIMLLAVFIIIYVIDYVSYMNSMLYGLPSVIPGITGPNNNIQQMVKKKKKHSIHF